MPSLENSPTVIDIEDLYFAYDRDIILENINLHVQALDFLAIIGPNGGGKSTLLRLMLGLLKPDSGTIRLFETSVEKGRDRIGYVPQNTNVNTDFPPLFDRSFK